MHVLGLFACCGILILGFFSIAHQFTVCLKNIQSTSERDVLLWAFKGGMLDYTQIRIHKQLTILF